MVSCSSYEQDTIIVNYFKLIAYNFYQVNQKTFQNYIYLEEIVVFLNISVLPQNNALIPTKRPKDFQIMFQKYILLHDWV